MRYRLGDAGFSLIEMLIVVAIIAVILAIAMPPLSNWMMKYTIEAQVRQLYGDIASLRAQALYKNRTHFVIFNPGTRNYQVVDDVNLNGKNDDAVIRTVTASQPFFVSAGIDIAGPTPFNFSNRGISSVADGATEAVCVPSDVSPDYDCIRIGQARMQLGKMSVMGGGCSAAICQAK